MRMNKKQEFETRGSLLFAETELPLTSAEWQRIESLLAEVEYEHIVGGDAGEGHSVRVCRFYNDVDKPIALHVHSEEISRIVMSAKMKSFYKKFSALMNCVCDVVRPTVCSRAIILACMSIRTATPIISPPLFFILIRTIAAARLSPVINSAAITVIHHKNVPY